MTDTPVQLSPAGDGDASKVEDSKEEGFENACRLCLTTDLERCSIFGVPHGPVPFVEKIRSCLSIQVSTNDKESTLICTKCIENVNQWYTYKDTCLQSQDKFMQWLVKTGLFPPQTITIKEEPVDLDYTEDPTVEILCDSVPQLNQMHLNNGTTMVAIPNNIDLLSEENFISSASNSQIISPIRIVNKEVEKPRQEGEKNLSITNVKSEPMESDDYSVEIDLSGGSELLLNPMAVASGKDAERVMEADSTQKFNNKGYAAKKKIRRGPHTHYRGTRVFKRKCVYCNINLSSKTSFANHMSRFHDYLPYNNVPSLDLSPQLPPPPVAKKQKKKIPELTERIAYRADSAVDQTAGIDRAAPLTPVQQNIISQLKTYSCYSCQQQFDDRHSTLNHIRMHMPDLRPYTCIACLTEFPNSAIYKQHCSVSLDCAMKIAMVIPKVGQEKYFTCNMCLRPMPNRSELLYHLSKHTAKTYEPTASSRRPPPKLRPMVPGLTPLAPQHIQQAQAQIQPPPYVDDGKPSVAPEIPGPYVNGDPSHNHMCNLCGMIYRYKPNMYKHRELCETLPETGRTSYRCVHCRMTFLNFKKFHTHVLQEHKKKELACFVCHAKYKSPDDYLMHHETHKPYSLNQTGIVERMDYPLERSVPSAQPSMDVTEQDEPTLEQEWDGYADDVPVNSIVEERHNCALCNLEFATNAELTEHRNLHLKVKIYSCVICRSMFSSSGALEIHMKDHGIEDPKEQNANSSCVEYGRSDNSKMNDSDLHMSGSSDPGGRNVCADCGRTFSNLANLKRHQKNVHTFVSTYTCSECGKTFRGKENYDHHIKTEHSKSPKHLMRCPKCPKTFAYQANLILHCQNAHSDHQSSGFSCDLCGKTFKEEQSLKTHRGWHMRTNNRLSIDKSRLSLTSDSAPVASTPKPAKARKSFPNPPQNQLTNLQCQVCDDHFSDVAELRKHLWELHCSRNKSEPNFEDGEEGEDDEPISEFRCEICQDAFVDEESLRAHMEWHEQNPYPEEPKKTFYCETCGKYYSNRKLYLRHKKLHKVIPIATMKLQSLNMKRPTCATCEKTFATEASLKRHKAMTSHYQVKRPVNPVRKSSVNQEPLQVNFKKEPGLPAEAPVKKRPVTCLICKSIFPSMSVLYQHKQLVHKSQPGKDKSVTVEECVPLPGAEGFVCCNICGKQFPGISNLKQHFSHKHKQPQNAIFPCNTPNCKLVFSTYNALKSHEMTHSSMIYSCNLCDRHVFSRGSMVKHMMTLHKAVYQSGADKQVLYAETDLSAYVVKGAEGTVCPKCKIKYPNMRALKIHYFKFHDKP